MCFSCSFVAAFALNLSNPVAATIPDCHGVATIQDNDSTKFYVVNDGSTDKVFKYTVAASRTSASQIADMSFALAVGNTNPQGIADPPMAPAGTPMGMGPDRASRATKSVRVIAVDDYLSTELVQHARRRSVSLADSFLDTLIVLDQRQGKLGTLKHGLR